MDLKCVCMNVCLKINLLHGLSSFPSVMFCILIVYRQYPSSRHVGGGLDREAIGPLSLCLLLLGIYWREKKNRTMNMKCNLQEERSHPNFGFYGPLQLDIVIWWDIGDTG